MLTKDTADGVAVVAVVVVETAVVAVEVPRVVAVVVSARTSLLVYVDLTIHIYLNS